jgi:hypothetical protein
MVRRKRKKMFPCGHQGRGKVCIRCKQEDEAARQKTQEQEKRLKQKALWNASFEQDVINLRGLPKHVVLKARRICRDLAKRKHFKHLGGSRFKFDRTVIRIPVGGRYRMLCRDEDGQVVPWQVMSHEAYNAYASNKRQVS